MKEITIKQVKNGYLIQMYEPKQDVDYIATNDVDLLLLLCQLFKIDRLLVIETLRK